MSVLDVKANLRTTAKALRQAAFERHGAKASQRIAAQGLDFLPASEAITVSGFLAIRDEIDPLPLLTNLHAEGYHLALPVMVGKGKPLVMKAWAPGDELAETMWGIREPLASAIEVFPDVLLVPLLAFDERGYRLGYGGGFYDRTLSGLRRRKPIVAVGIAYDEQKVDAVPHSDYDERLDWVLTPSGPQKMARSLP
jgi:5-formyltetrahydrofolate cyclo-ligase